MNPPTLPISVIIPLYNVEAYIERCARSLMEQTLESIEYIFVDDCSTDDSVKVLRKVLEEYPSRKACVKLIEKKKNEGVALARKSGLDLASGEYVIHCDSDDWVDKDMYRILYEEAKRSLADCMLCDYYETDGTQHKIKSYAYQGKHKLISDLLSYKRGGSLVCYLTKKGLYDKVVFPTKHMWEDLVVSVQLFYYASSVAKINKPLYYYYQNPKSVSYEPSLVSSIKRLEDSKQNVILIEKFLQNYGITDTYKTEIRLLKYYSKFFISEYTSCKEIKALWRNTFPEINIGILFDRHVPMEVKAKHVLLYVGLFHAFKSFASKHRIQNETIVK